MSLYEDGLDPAGPYDANCWRSCCSCSCGKADTADKVGDGSRPTDFISNPWLLKCVPLKAGSIPPFANCPTRSATDAVCDTGSIGIPPLQKMESLSPQIIVTTSLSTSSSGIRTAGSAGLSGIIWSVIYTALSAVRSLCSCVVFSWLLSPRVGAVLSISAGLSITADYISVRILLIYGSLTRGFHPVNSLLKYLRMESRTFTPIQVA